MATTALTITKPDDFHHHFRDGEALEALVPLVASRFRRAIAMPNLKPPVTTTAQALAYRERLMAAVPAGVDFTPLMTLYLTDQTTAEEIYAARDSGAVYAVKLYPAGATTNSDSGVTDMQTIRPALEAMAQVGMPLLVHSEVTDANVDIFDREAAFVVSVLGPLVRENPGLKVVMEHITTSEGVDFVMACGPNVGATITPQHLLYNRNAIFQGGLQPHMYCLPVLKHERHRQALLRAIASGSPKFFLGTDSAPHPKTAKETSCGCAGCFSAFAGLELYAEVFESLGVMDKFESFTSKNGAAFYGLPENQEKLTLRREPWTVPATYPLGKDVAVVPLKAGEEMAWAVKQE
ncbi:dihydroorotase [Nannochloropsis oceanica]